MRLGRVTSPYQIATLFFAVAGMATLASLVVMPGRRDSTAVLTRFLLWGGAVFLAASRGSARDWKKYAAAVLGTTAVAALVQPLHAIGDVGLRGSVAIVAAAGIEEVVFRALLPRAFAKLVEVSQRRDALTCSVPLFVAQLAFAATHLTLSGGLANRAAETEFVRLFGCGCCLATVYLFGGLVPAIIVHAFSNLIVLNPGPWQG